MALFSFAQNAKASFGRECKLVGDYIHDNAGQVYNALYVLYNGTGNRKVDSFERYYNSLAWRSNIDVGFGIEERNQYFKNSFQTHYDYLEEHSLHERDQFAKNLKDNFKLDYKKEEKLFNVFYARSFCKKLSDKRARKCRANLKKIFSLTNIQQIWPYSDGPTTSLSLPHIIQNVLTSPDHLRLATNTMAPLMSKALVKDYSSSSNIKDLLERNAKELTHLNKEQQDDLVWNTLAYYATRGASPEGYALNLTTDKTLYSFSVHYELINLMHVFDSQKTSGENLFSMPTIQKNSCLIGKPYHFWMSAYLARHLVKKGIDKKQAFFAASAAGTLYDFAGNGAPQRERIRIYREPLESIFTMSIQQSLLYKIAGAYYGSTGKDSLNIDMDELYQIIKDNQKKSKRKIYQSTIYHFKNLDNFLEHTAIDLVINHLAARF